MRFLITGFSPFGKSKTNPSAEAVRLLPDTLGGHEIFRAELPVVYGKCWDELHSQILRVQPDCVLCLGQAAGREGISLENTAVNVRASSEADNAGVTFSGEKIDEDGPESLSARLPMKELTQFLREAGLPAKISYSAGTYVCNDLFYHLMKTAAVPAGFIHVPQAAEEAPEGRAAMAQADINRGILEAVTVLAEMLIG